MKKRLKRELIRLCTGEVASVGIFWFCYLQISKLEAGRYLMKSTAYPLFVLSFILLQGAFYWWILYRQLTTDAPFAEKAGQVYRILKLMDIVLLCLGIPVIFITHLHWYSTGIGIFVLLFALIEWINYYAFRLSYGLNPLVLLRKLKDKTLVKSRLAREIENR